jgi:cobalt-zinc-cadmium efflux system membrane fusion protein
LLARVVLPNPAGEWRPGLFVTGEILLEVVEVPLAVKASAVQTFRDWTVVFVNEGDFYEPLVIEPGHSDGEWVEIITGMKPGLRYVTDNSFIIKADILKTGASHDH